MKGIFTFLLGLVVVMTIYPLTDAWITDWMTADSTLLFAVRAVQAMFFLCALVFAPIIAVFGFEGAVQYVEGAAAR